MQIIDFIAIAVVLLFFVVGLISGFGNGLKFFTSGIFGFIIAIAVCVALVPTICGTETVLGWFAGMNASIQSLGSIGETLATVVDYAIVGIVLFIVVQIVRMVIVAILKHIVEVDNIVFKVINKILGVVLYLGVVVILFAVVFSVIAVIGGDTSVNFYYWLRGGEEGSGSLFRIDEAYRLLSEVVSNILPKG